MNTKIINTIGAYAIGALVGGYGGYLIGHLVAQKIWEDQIVNDDISIDGKPYSEWVKEIDEMEENLKSKEKPEEVTKDPVNEDNKPASRKRHKSKNNIKKDYTKFYEKPGTPEETVKTLIPPDSWIKNGDLPEDILEELNPEENELADLLPDGDEPYIIDVGTFDADESVFEKQELYYYEGDDTLADMSDNVIKNPEKKVGGLALQNFGKGSKDPDIVYVRDENNQIDYEILRTKKSYAEEVMGLIQQEEIEKQPKKSKPKTKKVKTHDEDDEGE